MKWVRLLYMSIFFAAAMHAQNTSGIVIYEDNRDMHRDLSPEREMYRDRIPQYRTTVKELLFDGEESIYRKPEEPEEAPAPGDRRGGFRFGSSEGNTVYYVNTRERKDVESRKFLGKNFLIKGAPDFPRWKITPDQKQVGAYLCQRAIFTDSLKTVEAWFTPMIPVMTGPDGYGGLPGLILHLDIDDGLRTITATSISLGSIGENTLVRPENGEEITREEFEKLRKEKMDEREQMWKSHRRRWMNRR